MLIKGFTLINEEKVERSLSGVQRSDGSSIGGIGSGAYFDTTEQIWKKDGTSLSASEIEKLENDLLAEYDRIGGLIQKGGDKVKTGSFYDFKGKRPRTEPKVFFTYSVNGKFVDVPDGTELPGEVKAAKIMNEQNQEQRKSLKKIKKSKEDKEE